MKIDPNEVVISDRIDPSEVEIAQPPKAAPKQADSFLSRVGTGLADPIYGAAQIADKLLVDPIRQRVSPGATSMADVVRQRDAEYQAPEGFDAARVLGNVANPVSWAGGGAGVGRAALGGALQASLAPVNPDENFAVEKAKQAALGAGGGVALSKTMSGLRGTPEARALMEQGIQPSFGQSVGGVLNRLEQKATSIPLVGDAVQWARTRPLNELQERVIQMRTFGKAKTLDDADAFAKELYESVVPHLKPTRDAVQNVQKALADAASNPELTEPHQKMLTGIINQHFANFGALDGPAIKRLDSELGHLARKYQGGDPASKTLADEIYNVQRGLREGLESGLPPELQGRLQEANTVWRQMIPLHKAASQRADERIMPRALQRAIATQQRTDPSRLAYDPLIDNALKVLPNTVPDSGTAGRLLLGSAGALGASPLGMLPEYLTAGAIAGLGATRPVQRSIMGNTALQKALDPYNLRATQALIATLRGERDGNQ